MGSCQRQITGLMLVRLSILGDANFPNLQHQPTKPHASTKEWRCKILAQSTLNSTYGFPVGSSAHPACGRCGTEAAQTGPRRSAPPSRTAPRKPHWRQCCPQCPQSAPQTGWGGATATTRRRPCAELPEAAVSDPACRLRPPLTRTT